MDVQPSLKTERLLLRPFALSDAARVQRLAGDKRIADVTANIPHPYPDGLAETWISSHAGQWQAGGLASFAIALRESELLIGAVSLMNIHAGEGVREDEGAREGAREGELGYWVGTQFWGKGYCTEACRRIVDYGQQDLGLRRIHAHHLSRNPASGRVLLKCGLLHVGSSESECGYLKQVESTELYEWIHQ